MEKIRGLPRSAHIQGDNIRDLEIVNNRVVTKYGLLYWMIHAIKHDRWLNVLSQMIQQGFRFDGFIEECMDDLDDPEKFAILINEYDTKAYSWTIIELLKIAKGVHGNKIKSEFVIKLKTCKNWDQFFYAMNWNGSFVKKIYGEMEEIRRCNQY